MRHVAISACLLGEMCRYDGTHNVNEALVETLKEASLIPFCPEDFAFGTPRPTMDLIDTLEGVKAISNTTGEDLSSPIIHYAKTFFDTHPNINLLIGKERSPSCGVCSAKLYNTKKNLLSTEATGLMIQEAKKRGIVCIDSEKFNFKLL
jgi:uncharacterized protein YbbK (DUF523 family)